MVVMPLRRDSGSRGGMLAMMEEERSKRTSTGMLKLTSTSGVDGNGLSVRRGRVGGAETAPCRSSLVTIESIIESMGRHGPLSACGALSLRRSELLE